MDTQERIFYAATTQAVYMLSLADSLDTLRLKSSAPEAFRAVPAKPAAPLTGFDRALAATRSVTLLEDLHWFDGASGARLVTTAMYQLHRTGGRYALCTMCIGVGQGIAVIIERV